MIPNSIEKKQRGTKMWNSAVWSQ